MTRGAAALAALATAVALTTGGAPARGAACSPPLVNDNSPNHAALSSFAILRRPARPGDEWRDGRLLPPGVGFNQRFFRLARSFGGYRFYLLPGDRGCGGPTELFVGAAGSPSTVSGGATATSVRRFAEWSAQGTGAGSIVVGVVPDRVATVTLTYPKGRGHPGGVSYPRPVRRTLRVLHNFVVFRLARTPDDASSPARQVWRAASGRVIRVAPGNP